MKKTVFILILCSLCTLSMTQEIKWDYPIKPGSKDWEGLTTQEMKVNACQIPDEILTEMATENLVDLCLNYPLLINVTAFSTFQYGMENFIKDFNGIQELFLRPGSALLLKEKYLNLSIKYLDLNWTIIQKGKYAYDLMYLELFLSQKEFLRQLSKEDLELLLLNSIQKYYDKKELLSIYGEMSLNTIGLLISSIILQIDLNGELFSKPEVQDLNAKLNVNSPGIGIYVVKIDKIANDVKRLLK